MACHRRGIYENQHIIDNLKIVAVGDVLVIKVLIILLTSLLSATQIMYLVRGRIVKSVLVSVLLEIHRFVGKQSKILT